MGLPGTEVTAVGKFRRAVQNNSYPARFGGFMSLIVELSGMISGMLAERACLENWTKTKVFFSTSSALFGLFSINIIIFPSEKGVFIGLLTGGCLGIFGGLVLVGLMSLKRRYEKR